ncbi:DUF721 domain-containing protein [Yimella sp. cx-51]|uniref:DUF721 domain-containing protein n=1 Tax=Yimella sp. cx-51 TaxID=2770551 RepID=UPI001FCA5ADE|nr:DciA family protein [Yimella sp. cx-51]
MTDQPTPGEKGDTEPELDPLDAAREALSRARLAARGKGLRPGQQPRVRRKYDIPRDDGGRDPVGLADQMERLLVERGWRVDVAAGSVLAKWPQIVGPDVASHTHATGFEDGVLTVRADSTAWRTQLSYMTSTILAQIEAEIGADIVTELRILGPSAPSWNRGLRKVHGGRGPRDTYG